MKTRTQYLNNECTHNEYYNQFVSDDLIETVAKRFNKTRLLSAFKEDEHLNSIPLKEWDALAYSVGLGNTHLLKECGESLTLSVAVCILKAAATLSIKEKEGNEPEFELKHKGELIFTGSENECYFKLQKVQSQSADWAMKYEGYTITPKTL